MGRHARHVRVPGSTQRVLARLHESVPVQRIDAQRVARFGIAGFGGDADGVLVCRRRGGQEDVGVCSNHRPEPGRDRQLREAVPHGRVIHGNGNAAAFQLRQRIPRLEHWHGQFQRHGGALPLGTFHDELPAHQTRELAGDGQAQAGAAVAPRGRALGLHEWREQRGLYRRRDPDARIRDGDDEMRRVVGDARAFR